MTKVRIPYKPRDLQVTLHKDPSRFKVIVCHRRFGKTVMAINHLIRGAVLALKDGKDRPRFAYIAPLYKQAKTVAWDYLKHYSSAFPDARVNEAELRVDFANCRIQLFGADNPDAMRGQYFDGVVLDEYAQMNPKLWNQVIRPALSDRLGWAIFIGTPMGHNQFYHLYQEAESRKGWSRFLYRASETSLIAEEELEAAKQDMTDEEFEQEYECSWSAAIRGAFWGKEMATAEKDGRITNVPADPAVQVETWWDLGVADSTVIWFVQRVGQEIHVIDYYENTGEGLPHYAKMLDSKDYIYGAHIAPHDIEVRELGSGKSRKEIAFSLGIDFQVAPKLSVADGIDAVRNMIPRCWFDKEKCKVGIEALQQYRIEFNDRLRTFKTTPLHDWASHAADSFRYGAVSNPYYIGKHFDTSYEQQLDWVV